MSRLRRIAQQDRFFFVTTNLARGVATLSSVERTLILETLDAERLRTRFLIYAYVVLPDHLHLLLDPGQAGLTNVLRNFKSKTALAIAAGRKTSGPFWQPRFFDFVCRRVSDFGKKLDYIHQNPVCAKLVATPEDWHWSSAAWYLRRTKPLISIDPLEMPSDPQALLWPAPWR